ncbi:YHS domain-containing (seleno)protein [Antarcticimicrobium luteum]|nr:YHS domain-containing (seleno)protein [Antarcticimicrobium luteum]
MTLRPILSVLAALLMMTAVARADMPMFYSSKGAAIGGYDTVAYFTAGKAQRGRSDIAVMWKGAMWLFSNRRNRDIFEANPRAYAPQYGGYCAYAMSKGRALGTDPESWKIVDGKLYLIHNRTNMKVWVRNPPQYIVLSDGNWPEALGH